MPKLSVLMSVKNGGRFLHAAAKSVLDQTFRDFEFIVVDNASSDNSVQIIEAFGDPRIRLVRNEADLGQTRALNKGLALTQGQYLARMDADDVSLPERFQKQIECFEVHPETAVVGTWHQEIDENGRLLKIMKYPTEPLEIKCNLLSDGDLTRRCLAHPTVMMKTAVLKEAGGYNENIRFAQDYELWTRLVSRYEFRNVPEALFQYRATSASTSNANRADMVRELDQIVENLVRRLWPDINATSLRQLVAMLRNRSPLPGTGAQELYALFDQLFFQLFNQQPLSARQMALRERIKTYYWPRLARHDFLSALRTAGNVLPALADSKFQKNVAKTLLRR